MEYRDIQHIFQPLLDFKAAGSADIFQIDAAESRRDIDNGTYDLFCILGIQTDRYRIDAPKFFKKNCFSFHNRQSSVGTNVTKSQHGASIGYDSDGICLDCISVSLFPVFGDDFTWFCHTGSVGKGERFSGLYGSFGHCFQFAIPLFVEFQCFFICCHGTSSFLFSIVLYYIIFFGFLQNVFAFWEKSCIINISIIFRNWMFSDSFMYSSYDNSIRQ